MWKNWSDEIDNEEVSMFSHWLEDLKDMKEHCLHDNCPSCNGTGKKDNGQMCIHMISCPCRRCTPYSL